MGRVVATWCPIPGCAHGRQHGMGASRAGRGCQRAAWQGLGNIVWSCYEEKNFEYENKKLLLKEIRAGGQRAWRQWWVLCVHPEESWMPPGCLAAGRKTGKFTHLPYLRSQEACSN